MWRAQMGDWVGEKEEMVKVRENESQRRASWDGEGEGRMLSVGSRGVAGPAVHQPPLHLASLAQPSPAQRSDPAAYLSSCCPSSLSRRNRRRTRRGTAGWTSGLGQQRRGPPPAPRAWRCCSRARPGAGRWPPWRGLARGGCRPFWVSTGTARRSADAPAWLPAGPPHPEPPPSSWNSPLVARLPETPAGTALPPRAPLCAAAVVYDAAAATALATTKGREGEMESEGGGEPRREWGPRDAASLLPRDGVGGPTAGRHAPPSSRAQPAPALAHPSSTDRQLSKKRACPGLPQNGDGLPKERGGAGQSESCQWGSTTSRAPWKTLPLS